MILRDYLASAVRTVVPMAVGIALEFVAKRTGIVVPSAQVAPFVAAGGAALYYALVRLAETKWPLVGWLLGLAVPPSYTAPTATAAPEEGP